MAGLGRSPGEGKGYPLQYSGLENSMDYTYTVHGVAESKRTERLSLSRILPWTIHGQRNLEFYSPCGHKELDTTEAT